MFIQTDETFSVGQMIMLSIPYTNGEKHVKVAAEIVRVNDQGIGVEFVKKIRSPAA
jgi:Tfp pilus assembly protein PilZ